MPFGRPAASSRVLVMPAIGCDLFVTLSTIWATTACTSRPTSPPLELRPSALEAVA